MKVWRTHFGKFIKESQWRYKARITKMKKEDKAGESKTYQEKRGLRVAL